MAGKILFVGESWHVHTMESKGFDVFTYDYYEEAVGYIQEALCANGWEFEHIPSHLVEQRFPRSAEALSQYAAVFFSDVGANTLNLPMNVFMRQQPTLNKLDLVREYVENGGAFCMIGGYLSFQGIQGAPPTSARPLRRFCRSRCSKATTAWKRAVGFAWRSSIPATRLSPASPRSGRRSSATTA